MVCEGERGVKRGPFGRSIQKRMSVRLGYEMVTRREVERYEPRYPMSTSASLHPSHAATCHVSPIPSAVRVSASAAVTIVRSRRPVKGTDADAAG
jgi:hypothetical protein